MRHNSTKDKRTTWEAIKEHMPELIPILKELKEHFGPMNVTVETKEKA